MQRKKVQKILMYIIITIVTLYFGIKALSAVNLDLLLSAKVNWWLCAASVMFFTFSTLIRAFVYPFAIDTNISVFQSWRITVIGNAANMILPIRAGEGLRLTVFPKGYTISERTRLTIIPAIADIAIMLLLSAFSVFVADLSDPTLINVLNKICVVFVGLGILFLFVIFLSPHSKTVVKKYLNKQLIIMTVWVFLSWILVLISIWVGMIAFGFNAMISASMSIAAFSGMNLIMFIPSSPGGIGLFEYAVMLSLANFGIAPSTATTLGLLLHAIHYAALLPLGIVFFFVGRQDSKSYSLKEFSARRRQRRA